MTDSTHRDIPEVAAVLMWRKSSFSGSSGCVEVAVSGDNVLLRDTDDTVGTVLPVSAHAWYCFVAGIKNEEFELDLSPNHSAVGEHNL